MMSFSALIPWIFNGGFILCQGFKQTEQANTMHREGLQICSSVDENSHKKEILHIKQMFLEHLALLEGCFKCG